MLTNSILITNQQGQRYDRKLRLQSLTKGTCTTFLLCNVNDWLIKHLFRISRHGLVGAKQLFEDVAAQISSLPPHLYPSRTRFRFPEWARRRRAKKSDECGHWCPESRSGKDQPTAEARDQCYEAFCHS